MLKSTNDDIARFVGSILPEAMKSQSAAAAHRSLVAFHTGILLDFVKRSSESRAGPLDEGTLAWVLPAAMEPLQASASLEVESSKDSLISEVIVCFHDSFSRVET
jgi:U3 small nucleolar RNA-associated protein 10